MGLLTRFIDVPKENLALLAISTIAIISLFPGPPLWTTSRLPYIISLLRGRLVNDHVKIHEKYGDVVRLAPDEISFTNEAAWRDIYTHRKGHTDPTKDPVWYKAPDEVPQNIVTALDPAAHTKFRRLLNNSFTESALRSQSPLIDSYADLLIDRLWKLSVHSPSQSSGSVINIIDWASWFTVDIIGDLALGESFDCLKNSALHPWVKTLNNFLKGMVFAAATRWYPSVESLVFKLLLKSVMDLQKQHSDFANEKINRRLNLEKDRPDIITPFMKDNAGFQHVSLKETQSNFQILLVAGADTTATALSGTILYLMENPRVLQKLISEIRTSFATENEITVAAVKDLQYLNIVLHEGLQLTNPVPGGLPRIVPKGGDVYAGVFVPEGTSISVRPYAMSRSERYFASPNEFIPERWLPKGIRPTEFDKDHLDVSNPFSIGHSNCLGKLLADAEMRVFIARLLWAFDIEEEGKNVTWTALKTFMIIQKQPIMMKIKRREGINDFRKEDLMF